MKTAYKRKTAALSYEMTLDRETNEKSPGFMKAVCSEWGLYFLSFYLCCSVSLS